MNTLRLYNDTPLNMKNNYIIDDIDYFLDDYLRETINEFMFIDTSQLETSFILNYNYDEIDYASKAFSSVNYVALEQAGRTYYYFVTKATFAGKLSVRLDLRMDTLNTFNNYYTLSNRTLILREHKDRFIEMNHTHNTVKYWNRRIDRVSEGINPALYNTFSSYEAAPDIWYLVYQTQKPPVNEEGNEELINPVECYLVPKEAFAVNIVQSRTYTTISFQQAYTYYCILDSNSLNSIIVDGSTYYFSGDGDGTSYDNVTMITFKVDQSTGKFEVVAYFGNNTTNLISDTATQITFEGDWENINYTSQPISPDIETMKRRSVRDSKMYIGTNKMPTTRTIDDIDRTNSRLIKIIELPYPPLPISYDNLQIQLLTYYNGMFKLKDLNAAFKNTIVNGHLGELTESEPSSLLKEQLRNFELGIRENWESKMFHSDFYIPKYVYDSFSTSLPLELANNDFEEYDELDYTIDFIPTTTINSRFLFKINSNIGWVGRQQDFNFIINVARSNELTIYNNAYINYLRAGYNYDVKSKQRNITSSWVGVGLSAIGTIASFASSVYTGGIGIAGGIGLATSTAAQIYNAVNNQIQSEQNFSAKMQQLEMQSTSVYGADDIDLLNAYGGQCLQYIRYMPSPEMRELLVKLFYMFGYTSNRYGVPTMNTRKIFDYCQANIIFENTYNIPEEMQNDISQRFSEGVFNFHKLNYPNGSYGYDLTFTHENIETWLFNYWSQ